MPFAGTHAGRRRAAGTRTVTSKMVQPKKAHEWLEQSAFKAVSDAFAVYLNNVAADNEEADEMFLNRLEQIIGGYGHALALLDEFLE